MKIIILWFLPLAVSLVIAREKGRSVIRWFFIVFFAGILGFFILVFLPKEKKVRCPLCSRPLPKTTRKCRYCGVVLVKKKRRKKSRYVPKTEPGYARIRTKIVRFSIFLFWMSIIFSLFVIIKGRSL